MINVRGKEARAREWAQQTRLCLAFERGLATRLRREFHRVATKSKASFKEAGKVDAQTFDGHKAQLEKILSPFITGIIKTFAARTKTYLTQKASRSENEAAVDVYARKYIKERIKQHITDISKTSQDRISRTIADGREKGLGQDEIADNIEEATGGRIADARAKTIARTEVHSASQAGAVASVEALGLQNVVKEWVSAQDERTREDHADTDGDTAAMDEPFIVGGEPLMFPGDPDGSPEQIINCRCVLTYKVETEI